MSLNGNSDDYKAEEATAVNTVDGAYITISHSRVNMPSGWTRYIHPQGWVYFRNDEYKLVVDEDIRSRETLAGVTEYCNKNPPSTLPDGLEACLLGSLGSYFYLVIDHNQCVADYAAVQPIQEWVPFAEMSTADLIRRRRLYWNYFQQHPSHCAIHRRALTEATDAVKSYYFDNLVLGERSVAPFSKAECTDLLQQLEISQDTLSRETSLVTLVAWILREVYSYRHAEGYGKFTFQRFHSNQRSRVHPTYVRNELSTVARLFLRILVKGPFFGIPGTYLDHIQQASQFRGRLSSLQKSWKDYTDQLIREYSDFILISTVLLSATVALLSVSDIAQLARVCAIAAAFGSLGSIATGVFFVWKHQRDSQTAPTRTFAYINNAHRNVFGLPGHALFLSLPPVLLVWSVIAFTVAIVAYSLQPITGNSVTDVASTTVTLAIFLVVTVSTSLAIYVFIRMWNWNSALGFGIVRKCIQSLRLPNPGSSRK